MLRNLRKDYQNGGLWCVAANLLPKKLVYWTIIRAGSVFGTSPDAITCLDLLKRWGKGDA